ncbi:Uncharacterised protein [Bordetella pertussis]|nr:Uncharacterised protein [Bordetella pertussis]CFP65508.1 Uncharacterised protein [Bordetella pertussis]CFW45754.1 Uncharacterised protein [Bordetella pertussis]CPL27474.1 Uncharacterised protein [Bordetella pertussis]CPN19393.1 Uncharacterised protein [Bordetella pertussis]
MTLSLRNTLMGSSSVQSDNSTTWSRSARTGSARLGSMTMAPYRPVCSWNPEWL